MEENNTNPPPNPQPNPQPQPQGDNGQAVAIVAYFSLIGFIVAYVMHSNNKTTLGAYHLRQALGIMLTGLVIYVVLLITIVGILAIPFVGIGILVLWIIGLISAINKQEKPVPLLGAFYQKTFAGIN